MKKIQTPEEIMIEGVRVVIAQNKPLDFLDFINDAILWIHQTEWDTPDADHLYDCHIIINHIIIPWIKGGDKVAEE
ncbi:MAG TPA: hypothetical protein VGG71_14460, partial [Chitinophagaceae bacterium]